MIRDFDEEVLYGGIYVSKQKPKPSNSPPYLSPPPYPTFTTSSRQDLFSQILYIMLLKPGYFHLLVL